MTRPSRFLFRMIVFVVVVAALAVFLFRPLTEAFMSNAALNGLILGVLILGIAYNFRQVAMIYPETTWLDTFRQRVHDAESGIGHAYLPEGEPPRLLAPMAAMLGDRRGGLRLSTLSTRSMLDGIAARLDESRDLSRYTIGLLIFLGLLGTFWGLLTTVASVGDVIGSLSINGGGDATSVFGELKRGLEAPIEGMGTAFSSSLFGLAGSLVLGFLDLQTSQAQNRFYNDLEEWLASITQLSSGAFGSFEGDHSVPAYVQALLEQTAESLENLQRTIGRGEESRIMVNEKISSLSDRLEGLTDHLRTEQAVMRRLAESQSELRPAIGRLVDTLSETGSQGVDDATRNHIRNIDLHLARLADDLLGGREEMLQEIKSELRLLTRTLAAGRESGSRFRDDEF